MPSIEQELSGTRDQVLAESPVNSGSFPIPTDQTRDSTEPVVDEARQRQLDLEQAASTPIPSSLPRERSSSSAATSSYLSSPIEETGPTYYIPSQSFSVIFVDFLLDQNSNLATYCQQCIVNIASHLSYIANTEEEPSTSITAEIAKELLRTEIFEGVIMNLYNITNGQQPFQSRQQAVDDQIPDGGADIPQSIDEGEMNLAKMMCLSVRTNGDDALRVVTNAQ